MHNILISVRHNIINGFVFNFSIFFFIYFFLFHFHSKGTFVRYILKLLQKWRRNYIKKNQQKHNKVCWAGWLNMKKNIIKMLSKAKYYSLQRLMSWMTFILDESASQTVTAHSTESQIEKNLI